jgi:5-hydroxyisourate hydrolase
MSTISTHVLDTARGCPAGGMDITLERQVDGAWVRLGGGTTDGDGRVGDLVPGRRIELGVHRMTFGTGGYHDALGVAGFYPEVRVCFEILAADEHYHVPLLISPFGYSTYRGS